MVFSHDVVSEIMQRDILSYAYKSMKVLWLLMHSFVSIATNSVVIIVAASSKWLDGFRKWYYNAAGFNKLGEFLFSVVLLLFLNAMLFKSSYSYKKMFYFVFVCIKFKIKLF